MFVEVLLAVKVKVVFDVTLNLVRYNFAPLSPND